MSSSTIELNQRLLQVNCPALGRASLLPLLIEGQAAISQSYEFKIRGLLQEGLVLDDDALLYSPLSCRIQQQPHVDNYLHGLITCVRYLAPSGHVELVISPWLALLKDTQDCRIYQNQSIPDIVSTLFIEKGFSDFDFSKLTRTYPTLPYVTQFNESYYDFIVRLLTTAGIYFYFSFKKDTHTLCAVDSSVKTPLMKPVILSQQATTTEPAVTKLQFNRSLGVATLKQADYNPMIPSSRLPTTAASDSAYDHPMLHTLSYYHYPSGHQEASDGQMATQNKIDTLNCEHLYVLGNSDCDQFFAGARFKLQEDDKENSFLITQLSLKAEDHSNLVGQSASKQRYYHNTFRAHPLHQATFRPPSLPKPQLHGVHTATVTGPSTKSLHVNEQGYVKVQFHWDRYGQHNDHSSTWLRVSHQVASEGAGTFFTPRVGDEVLVSFINADPDRPIIMGSVYNSVNQPAFNLPAEKWITGIKTTSQHQLTFDDTPGASRVLLKSAKSMTQQVGHNMQQMVQGDSQVSIAQGSQQIDVKLGASQLTAKQQVHLHVKSSSLKVKPDGITLSAPKISFNPGLPDLNDHTIPCAPPTPSKHDLVELLYVTGTHTFYALTFDELTAFNKDNQQLDQLMQQVISANQDTTDQRDQKIEHAKITLNKKIKPLVKGAGKSKITEVVRFTGKKYTYVQSDKIKNHWRSYKMDTDNKARSIMTNGKPDIKKLKEKLDKKISVQFWGHDTNSSLGSWAQSFNSQADLSKALIGSKERPILDASADAQLLRYTAGLSGGCNYDYKGNMSLSAKGKAELALAEAKMKIACYVPNKAGYHLWLVPQSRTAQTNTVKPLDFGYIQVALEIGLYGYVGANILGNVNIALSMDKQHGKLQLKGNNIKTTWKEGKQTHVSMGVDAFAGAKAGCEASACISWQNPEVGSGWSEFASINVDGDVAAGLGGSLSFDVHYNTREEKFVIRAQAGLICGFGVSGYVNTVVYAQHVGSFVAFCYHKIMSHDYRYLGFISERAFKMLCNMLTKFILDDTSELETVVTEEFKELADWCRQHANSFIYASTKMKKATKIADSINNPCKQITYAQGQVSSPLALIPPEVKGRLLYLLTDKDLITEVTDEISASDLPAHFGILSPYESKAVGEINNLCKAICMLLSYIQSQADFDNVMQHMHIEDVAKKVDHPQDSKQRLHNALSHYGGYSLKAFIKALDEGTVYPQHPQTPHSLNNKVTQCPGVLHYVPDLSHN